MESSRAGAVRSWFWFHLELQSFGVRDVYGCRRLIHLGLQSPHRCLFQPTVFVPHAHWEVYGRGSLPLHNLVSDSANPHYLSDPLPRHCGIIVALDSSEPWFQEVISSTVK